MYRRPAAPLVVPQTGAWSALGWGMYLGTSWTWVIGMLLPALLLRDYGWWGWVAFVLPNVGGAAAMAWIVRTPAHAADLATEYRRAGLAFSLVTLVYHVFVVGWLVRWDWGWLGLPLLGLGLVVCGGLVRGARPWGLFAAASAVLAVSLTAFLAASRLPGAYLAGSVAPALGPAFLWAFVPASVAGFLTCPYLDLTFLRARAATGVGAGRAAFVIGFGGVFAPMLVFSACYAHLLGPFFAGVAGAAFPGLWALLLPLHLVLQIALTLTFHGLEVAQRLSSLGRALVVLGLFFALGLGCCCAHPDALAQPFVSSPDMPAWVGGWLTSLGTRMPWPEVGYRVLLVMYGAVFPSYVLLYMWPTHRPVPRRFQRIVFAVVAVVTYAAGCVTFVDLRPGGMIVASLALVLGRVLVEGAAWQKAG